ncbi:outer membrane protein [Siculibacillus lacustris]|nr:outer membrane protein [Siculibacillus lacustris]
MTFALASTAAQGADLALRGPKVVPVAPEPFSWSGVYGGLIAGHTWQNDHAVETYTANGAPTGLVYDFNPTGGSIGARLGANYQLGLFVAGIEGDFEATNVNGGFRDAPIGKGRDNTHWQGSVRGRLGVGFERVLVYGTGGVAFANIENTYVYLPTSTKETFTNTRTGWTVGGGADLALTDNWIAGVDYRHSDYGKTHNVSQVAFPGLTGIHAQVADTLHLSLAYKF